VRVLIGCEFSAVVRDAFRKRGHDAWSCDLLETEGDVRWHLQADIFTVLDRGWDLFIFHWPCTRLTNSGVRWLYGGRGQVRDEGRWQLMLEDAESFRRLLNAPVLYICGENPIPHRYAKEVMGDYSQVVQPWMFGHGETKATCLWLRNLPLLRPTNIVTGRQPRVHYESPGPSRWKNRSRTMPGIALAMSEQWGNLG
jgi:hypothetical protein